MEIVSFLKFSNFADIVTKFGTYIQAWPVAVYIIIRTITPSKYVIDEEIRECRVMMGVVGFGLGGRDICFIFQKQTSSLIIFHLK